MSAYRSQVQASRATHTLLCRACGEIVLASDDPDVSCRACGLAQPALRDDEAWSIAATDLVSQRIAGYHELDAFSASIGAPLSAAQITLRCDGLELSVSLALDSGGAVGLDLTAMTSGFPAILLRRETDTDVDAKELGASREVQTGDEAFDRAVYIESEAPDADILRVLSAPAVRRAIVRLLRDTPTITLESALITLSGNRGAPQCFVPDRINELLAALRVLAGAPRPLVVAPKKAPIANLLSLAVAPLGIVTLVWSYRRFPALNAETLGGLGAIAGIIVAMAVQPLITRLLRGRASSHRNMLQGRVASVIGIPPLLVACLLLLNGALDRSPEVEHHLITLSIAYDDEDHDHTTIRAGNDDGLTVKLWAEDSAREVKEGDAVTVWSRGGALGTPWRTRPSVVATSGGTLLVE